MTDIEQLMMSLEQCEKDASEFCAEIGRLKAERDHLADELARVRAATMKLINYALTADTRCSTVTWLTGLADRINVAAEAVGETDRAEVEVSNRKARSARLIIVRAEEAEAIP